MMYYSDNIIDNIINEYDDTGCDDNIGYLSDDDMTFIDDRQFINNIDSTSKERQMIEVIKRNKGKTKDEIVEAIYKTFKVKPRSALTYFYRLRKFA